MALLVATRRQGQAVSPQNGFPTEGDNVSIEPVSGSENQQWILNDSTGIPGVFTIANKIDPSLFLTAPLDPRNGDTVSLSTKIGGLGRPSQQQLWRLVPDGGDSNSVIQNYARGTGLVIDIPSGNTGVPIQMWARQGNANQSFYVDAVTAV